MTKTFSRLYVNLKIFAIRFLNFCEHITYDIWAKFDQIVVNLLFFDNDDLTTMNFLNQLKFDEKIRKHRIWIRYALLTFAKTIWFFLWFENFKFKNIILQFRYECEFSIVKFIEIFIVKLTKKFLQICYFFVKFSRSIVFFVIFSII